jgi:DNA-binding NtrC family response regulator
VANILIIDEEDDSRKLLKRLLERNGHHAWAFVNQAEALACIANTKLDLALMSVTSRRGTALAILDELKRANPDLKVMVIADFGPEVTAEAISADSFLIKPVDLDAVEKQVRELLKHRSPDMGLDSEINYNTTGSLNK